MINISYPEQVNIALTRLHSAGHSAYLVGGCLRDSLMGLTPHDFDIATSAVPEDVKGVFAGYTVIDTGIKHGTVTVHINHEAIEITTYRKESSYSDGRHPDKVEFADDLMEDLSRRDFTMNSMAYNREEGLVDPFGGMKDIEGKLIRAVGNPSERFSEDGLRVLRALRFSATTGFDIEKETATAIVEEKDKLLSISKERFYDELTRLLCGDHAEDVLLAYPDVIGVIIPEILPMVGFEQHNKYHIYDVYTHTAKVVANVPAEKTLRLAALFHDISKPACYVEEEGVGHFYGHEKVSAEMADRIMRRLKADNATRERVVNLVRWHDLRPEATDKAVKRAMSKVGEENFHDWLAIKRGDNLGQAEWLRERQKQLDAVESIGDRVIAEGQCFSIKSLAVSGRDLLDVGIPEGPLVGLVLNSLLEKVLEEEIPNEKVALTEEAKAIYKEVSP